MIRFSRYIRVYFFVSALVLVPGILGLVRFGLRPGVDFTGGTVVEFQAAGLTESVISEVSKSNSLTLIDVTKIGDQSYVLRFQTDTERKVENFLEQLQKKTTNLTVNRQETVGPVLGRELLEKALIAAILSIVGILAYVAYAFKNIKFGVSAVVALLHDLLVVIGVFSLLGHFLQVEVDTLFVTAFLTTMSFSVHDTIVVFDRIREYTRRGGRGNFSQISDQALTETMGRSLTNSFTIIFMLLSLILLGGETIRWFVVALLVGTISGTYSSPFVATPVLIFWDKWEKRRKKAE